MSDQITRRPEPETHAYPYGLDLLFVFIGVQTGPLAPFLVGGAIAFAIARRSALFLGLLLDLAGQLAGDIAIPDTPQIRTLLPGLEQVPRVKDAPRLAQAEQPRLPQAQTQADQAGVDLPMLELDALAASRNVLIVGSPGSGKTTLLTALLARRGHPVYVFDPHAGPGDWPGAALVIGAGRDFAGIYRQLVNAERRLDARSKQRASGERTTFTPVTLAGDEWGSICSEILTSKENDSPGRILLRLLKEGRKFGLNAILSAHGDTAASVGSKGDTRAFRLSFDWIVYTGGYVARHVGEQVRTFPMGCTPEGNSFPLVVAAVNPATEEVRLVDMRGLRVNPSQPHQRTQDSPPALPGTGSQDMLHALLTGGTQDNGPVPADGGSLVPADTNAVPDGGSHDPGTGYRDVGTSTQDGPGTTDLELITALVQAGWSANKIYKQVGGKRTEVLDLVRQLRAHMTGVDDDDGPEPDVGPFGRYL
jgi:GTPase SAR1 family protein